MRTTTTTLLPLFALLLVSGCSSLEVSADYDPKVDFGAYKTVGWVAKPGQTIKPESRSDLLEQRVRKAVDAGLTAKGLKIAAEPDLWINYHAAVTQKVDLTAYRDYPTRSGWVSSGGGGRVYDEGTLLIDLIDRKANHLVWRGMARGEVNMFASPEAREARVREAVDAILLRYPPNKAKK